MEFFKGEFNSADDGYGGFKYLLFEIEHMSVTDLPQIYTSELGETKKSDEVVIIYS